MIETRAWNLNKDDTVHKAAGSVHLRKYGQFFNKLAENNWQESSSWEYIIEGPIRLSYQVREDVSILDLADTHSRTFNKILTTVTGTCREVS